MMNMLFLRKNRDILKCARRWALRLASWFDDAVLARAFGMRPAVFVHPGSHISNDSFGRAKCSGGERQTPDPVHQSRVQPTICVFDGLFHCAPPPKAGVALRPSRESICTRVRGWALRVDFARYFSRILAAAKIVRTP